MKNILREKMLRGEKTIGTFFEIGSDSGVECLGLGGFDYIIIDGEHGAFDPQSTLHFARTAKLYGCTPIARVKDVTRASVLQMLDAGAMGLIVPCVNTVEEVERLVSYGKYAPLGNRGVSSAAGTGFWFEPYAEQGMEHIFEVANRETMLIPQCETAGCLAHIEEIVAIEGVDGIFVGPFDLSTSLGIPGQFDRPEYKEAVEHIHRVCMEAGKPDIIFAGTVDAARAAFEQGFKSVTYSLDANIIINASRQAIGEILA